MHYCALEQGQDWLEGGQQYLTNQVFYRALFS